MNQHILSEGNLLDKNGNLVEAGYSVSEVRRYNREAICHGKLRIKEWDYYYIGNDEIGIALTIADNGYMSLVSASLMDFVTKEFTTDSEIKFFSLGKLGLPASSDSGVTKYESNRVKMNFGVDEDRILTCKFDKWGKQKQTFECKILLSGKPESMVIATPFDKKGCFYYNRKINCLKAQGFYSLNGEKKPINGFGVLDWGRGVWTYSNTWYWSSLSCKSNDLTVGFNLGYGFGNTSAATENMIFVNGKAYKVGNVVFQIPMIDKKYNYLSEWKIISDDGSVDLTFRPILDRKDCTSVLGLLKSDQHQVFGKFYGTLNTTEHSVILDGQVGFAERVFNKW